MGKRWMVLALVVCGVLAVGGCGGPAWTCEQVQAQLSVSQSKAVVPVPRTDKDWWMPRHEAVNAQMRQGNVELLLLGDSITHGWDNRAELWETYFGRWNTVNAGFSGDQTQHVLWRLENGHLDGSEPKVAMIMIGTNNSNGDAFSAEEIAEGIAAIVCKLRSELPKTKVLILGIFPRGSKEQRDIKGADATFNPQWAKNDAASQLASRLADGKQVFYLNINDTFLDDNGVLTRQVMPDLLHLSDAAYGQWGQAVTPMLEKLMAN